MKTKTKALICVILLLVSVAGFFAGYVTGILSVEKAIPSGTNIVTDFNLSVYANDVAIEQLVYVSFGDLQPLQSKTLELWIQNDAQIPMTISLSTREWMPSYAESTFTFSYQGKTNWGGDYPVLQAGWRACMLLTLTASETVPAGAIAFSVVVHGQAGS